MRVKGGSLSTTSEPNSHPKWVCGSCGTVGGTRLPGWEDPRRCQQCRALVFPDGRYRYNDIVYGPIDAVLLDDRVTPRVQIHLEAQIQQQTVLARQKGDLVLDGQDLGPGVAAIWGDSDYEYRVTVQKRHLPKLAKALLRELAGGDISALLDRYQVGTAPPGTPGGAVVRVGQVSLRRKDLGFLILVLLRGAFADGTFKDDVAFRAWCKRKSIPTEFSSYI